MNHEPAKEEKVPEWVNLVMSLICEEDIEETSELIERYKEEDNQPSLQE